MERSGFDEQRQILGQTQLYGDDRHGGCIDSQAILGGRDEVLIRHGDQVYRLRKTRHGKLILNK